MQLYWQAFGGKLGRVMGPERLALRFLTRVLRGDHAIVALDAKGVLLGMAGFKTPAGSFAGGEMADVLAIYGANWARLAAAAVVDAGEYVDNDRLAGRHLRGAGRAGPRHRQRAECRPSRPRRWRAAMNRCD